MNNGQASSTSTVANPSSTPSQTNPQSQSSETPVFSRELLNSVWQRMEQLNPAERSIIIRHLSNIPGRGNTTETRTGSTSNYVSTNFINRRRSRNLFNVALPPVEEEHEYFDFRLYPEPIDWSEIENGASENYEIFCNYGYFGAFLTTSLSSVINLKLRNSSFLYSIVIYFMSLMTTNKSIEITSFIQKLPKLSSINNIIENHFYSKKDLLPIKVVLDIYERYYTFYDEISIHLKEDYLPVCKLFYSCLNEEDIKNIYESIVNNKRLHLALRKFIY